MDEENEDCGHPECKTIRQQLATIREEQGYAAWEEALFTLGHLTPHHSGETEHPAVRAERLADEWEERMTHPYMGISQEEYAEVQREMKEDDRRDVFFLDLWERLTEEGKRRALSEGEKFDIGVCEENFGGREKLIAALQKRNANR